MNRIIANKLDNFNSNIKYYEEKVSDKDEYYVDLKNRMKELTKMYFDTMDVEVKKSIINTLSECYDLLYYINFKKNPGRTFLLDDDIEKLPTIFLIDQKPKRFDINPGLLSDIDISKGLSEEQAEELLMWSSNNTRDNLNISSANSNIDEDVYDNDSLQGACGFSQFSSLYPLQKLGLHITVNNIGRISKCSHAFGTVVIPINKDGKIIEKRYIIDCTYRQFFTIPFNVVGRYNILDCIDDESLQEKIANEILSNYNGRYNPNSSPMAGFFVVQSEKEISFARELLQKGYVEATKENLEMYLKPFYSMNYKIDDTDKIDDEFSKIDFVDILENKQEDFDCTEDEFIRWGMNLELNHGSVSLH